MKTKIIKHFKVLIYLLTIVIMVSGCENDPNDFDEASFPKTAEIFIEDVIGMGTNFYFPYNGSKLNAWTVDREVGYNSSASMRFDVPNANDPAGSYAGAIFRTEGAGRDLSGYDALTFYIKASQGVNIAEFGFGEDFLGNKYIATITNVSVGTNWQKVIIPIPDPSKLVQERGMFRYAAGSQGTNSLGYTFWVDDLKFEKLGTSLLLNTSILNGQDQIVNTYTGASQIINGLNAIFNLANGQNISVIAAPGYFNFKSSNESVATVDEFGIVEVIGLTGSSVVTATVGNSISQGSLSLTSNGLFPQSPTPTNPASNVLSVFSNAYTNVVEPNFNPAFGGSTTVTTIDTFNGNQIATYSLNNYTGIMFDSTPIDATTRTFMHVDVFVPNGSTTIEFQIRDIGANQMLETNVNNGFPTGDDKDYRYTTTGLVANQWNSINIPLAGNLATQKNNLGAIIIVGGPSFILDNIYFYFP